MLVAAGLHLPVRVAGGGAQGCGDAPVLAPLAQAVGSGRVTDALPAMALGVEPPEPDVMQRSPRPPGERVITGRRGLRVLYHGGLNAAAVAVASPTEPTAAAPPPVSEPTTPPPFPRKGVRRDCGLQCHDSLVCTVVN